MHIRYKKDAAPSRENMVPARPTFYLQQHQVLIYGRR